MFVVVVSSGNEGLLLVVVAAVDGSHATSHTTSHYRSTGAPVPASPSCLNRGWSRGLFFK